MKIIKESIQTFTVKVHCRECSEMVDKAIKLKEYHKSSEENTICLCCLKKAVKILEQESCNQDRKDGE